MFQRILNGMLAAGETTTDITGATTETLTAITNYIFTILGALIGVAAAIGIVYCIVIAVKMARADNAEQREEAKKKVIYTVVGIAIAVALMLILLLLKDQIPVWLRGAGADIPDESAVIGLL